MKPIVKVRDLGKEYRIGVRRAAYLTIRETIVRNLQEPARLFGRRQESANNTIWALRAVSFDVLPGKVVGIVGLNGSGKSTLLKILSRITEPSTGSVELYGRVGSLLEVGTGFHQELTGRENIYLNGSILGMTRREIDRKLDEIVAFAEVEKFLETPVKRYSSGMYVRLAFSVAAHLDPEILLIDEVLAVGDANFQRKCLGKMGEVAREGRTVLFVSHNMTTVQALCESVCLLENGRLLHQGPAGEVVHHYLQSLNSVRILPIDQRRDRLGDGSAQITSIRVESADSGPAIRSTSRLRIAIDYVSDKPILHPRFIISVYDLSYTGIYALNSGVSADFAETIPSQGTVVCETAAINLTPGQCFLNISLYHGNIRADRLEYACFVEVIGEDFDGSGTLPERSYALCLLQQSWSVVDKSREGVGENPE